ncbi:DUF937 domain-containing protein [Gulosibacter hominis]|uniref:DUF937 domain-containing protein n=1 Tax=Gulosibacter hominis TaxID=2770504 RepID=UPI001919364A|nr:DUF937 domain-containing protein [Gulosibacter hominis]
MSELNSLLDSIPIEQIAEQLGVSTDEARRAIDAALPSLVGGMQANAADAAGAASLSSALGAHAESSLLDGGIDAASVDTEDGAKIAHNVFGDNEGAVTEQVALFGGVSPALIQKVLPILAPIVMAWLGKQVFGGDAAPQQKPGRRGGNGSLDDLKDMLDGNRNEPDRREPAGGGLDIGSILGGLLGGGKGGLGGRFGDLLGTIGGLLGGGRR